MSQFDSLNTQNKPEINIGPSTKFQVSKFTRSKIKVGGTGLY
jgi:hypothetical protein